MSAAELKAAWEALVAEVAKNPDDAALKSKVEAAKAAYDAKVAQDAAAAAAASTSSELDVEKLDEKTRSYVQSLRKEAAKYRTEAKAAKEKVETISKALGVNVDETAEQKAARMTVEKETADFNNAVLENAIEHGVPKDGMKFFRYLIAEAAQELKDGEELSPGKIAELANEAKAKSVKTAATTTVITNGAGNGTPPPGNANDPELTPEKFAALGFSDKCKLYDTNPTLYESLMKQATAKRLIK